MANDSVGRRQRETKPPAGRVSQGALAKRIGLSRERVNQLVGERVLELGPDGRMDADASILAYIRFIRNARPQSAAADRLREAKAIAVEMRTAREAHDLIKTDESIAVVQDIVGTVLTGLSGLPARVAGKDLGLRRRIEAEIFTIRQTAARRLSEQAAAMRKTGGATNTPATFGPANAGQVSSGP